MANSVQRSNTARQTTAPQADFPGHFLKKYESHLKHLTLKGLQPKTIDAYARGVRRIGEYFSYRVDALSADDLAGYFTDLLAANSWSGVKLDPSLGSSLATCLPAFAVRLRARCVRLPNGN